jgi:hypothetical protein
MALDREQLFVALFARLQTALAGTVKSFSRRWTSWDDQNPANQPALLLLKGPEHARRDHMGTPIVWTLGAEIWVWAQDDGSAEAIPSTLLNQILTAIEAALEISPAELTAASAQYIARRDPPPAGTTLGGLCIRCEIMGEVKVFEGTQGHVGVIKIPVEIEAVAAGGM